MQRKKKERGKKKKCLVRFSLKWKKVNKKKPLNWTINTWRISCSWAWRRRWWWWRCRRFWWRRWRWGKSWVIWLSWRWRRRRRRSIIKIISHHLKNSCSCNLIKKSRVWSHSFVFSIQFIIKETIQTINK